MATPHYFVTAVTPLDDHRLRLTFEDGLTGDVDLTDLIRRGGVFAPLADLDNFRQARLDPDAGTVVWCDDLDVAPETLYERARANRLSA